MAFTGAYELVRDEGSLEHSLAIGIPEDFAKKSASQKILEISIDGDKITMGRGDGPRPVFTLNQEMEETYNGKTFKNTAKLEGNVLTIDSVGENGTWNRKYTLAGSELTVISSHTKPGVPNAKRLFKKL